MSKSSWFRFLVAGAVALLLAGSGTASASIPSSNPQALAGTVTEPSVGLLNSGLLNLSRFDIHHSLSFGYTSSSAYGSQSGGLWLTQIGYRISDPLRISVDLGATLTPDGNSLLSEKSFFVGGFNLNYQPSKKFQLNISYVNLPSRAATALGYQRSPFGGYSRPWEVSQGLPR